MPAIEVSIKLHDSTQHRFFSSSSHECSSHAMTKPWHFATNPRETKEKRANQSQARLGPMSLVGQKPHMRKVRFWRWSQPVDATLYLREEMECALMGRRFHRGFTAAEKTELWDRWKRGESLKAIGRAFGKPSSSIYFLVAPHGGFRPAQRRRSRLALTLAEREVISRGVTAHQVRALWRP